MSFDLSAALLVHSAFLIPLYMLADPNPLIASNLSATSTFLASLILNSLLYRYLMWCIAMVAGSRILTVIACGQLEYSELCEFVCFSRPLFGANVILWPIDTRRRSVLGWLQSYNPTKLLAAEAMSLTFVGRSWLSDATAAMLQEARVGNSTELVFDCQRKRVLSRKLSQVSS